MRRMTLKKQENLQYFYGIKVVYRLFKICMYSSGFDIGICNSDMLKSFYEKFAQILLKFKKFNNHFITRRGEI